MDRASRLFAEWQRVREPFHTKSDSGPGLGLAIAGDVVRLTGANFASRERSETGFAVVLRFRRPLDSQEAAPLDGPS